MSVVLPSESFKSRESVFDNKTVKALEAKKNPEIRFDLTNEKLSTGKTDHTFVMTATGTITVAGRTTPITLTSDATIRDNQVFVKGVQKLDIADFKRVRSSDSLVVTSASGKDEVEVHYDLLFETK
jgi:polyisoprenoid-binding protein YceI